jgi:hypothetical protein
MIEDEQPRRLEERWDTWSKRLIDLAISCIGLAGCIFVIFFKPETPSAILILLAAMIGVPFVLSADHQQRRDKNDEG